MNITMKILSLNIILASMLLNDWICTVIIDRWEFQTCKREIQTTQNSSLFWNGARKFYENLENGSSECKETMIKRYFGLKFIYLALHIKLILP